MKRNPGRPPKLEGPLEAAERTRLSRAARLKNQGKRIDVMLSPDAHEALKQIQAEYPREAGASIKTVIEDLLLAEIVRRQRKLKGKEK